MRDITFIYSSSGIILFKFEGCLPISKLLSKSKFHYREKGRKK